MATTYKVLGQKALTEVTTDILYTVPVGKYAIISSLVIANRSSSNATYSIIVRPAADLVTQDKHYIIRGVTVAANDSSPVLIGITLSQSDTIIVETTSASLTFSAFGSENDI